MDGMTPRWVERASDSSGGGRAKLLRGMLTRVAGMRFYCTYMVGWRAEMCQLVGDRAMEMLKLWSGARRPTDDGGEAVIADGIATHS